MIVYFDSKAKKIGFFYHFLEIRIRFFFGIFSVLLCFFTAYCFSFELLYLFVQPFFAPKIFIFTDLTEALSTTMKVCFIYSMVVSLPYFIYQIWCFLIPSLLIVERKKIKGFLALSFFLFFFSHFFLYFHLLPEIFYFLFTFEIKKELLTIQLEARINSYVEFTFYIYCLFFLFFQIPLLFVILFINNIVTPVHLSKFRKYYIFCSLLVAALLSPPEVVSQLYIAFFFYLCMNVVYG